MEASTFAIKGNNILGIRKQIVFPRRCEIRSTSISMMNRTNCFGLRLGGSGSVTMEAELTRARMGSRGGIFGSLAKPRFVRVQASGSSLLLIRTDF